MSIKLKRIFIYITLITFSVFISAMIMLKVLGVRTFNILSGNMMPNFNPGEKVVVLKKYYKENPIIRGDVVVFRYPEDERTYIGRVVGLGGEVIQIWGSDVHINKEALPEPYVDQELSQGNHTMLQKQIGDDQLFIMGDNRDNSRDSRHIGNIYASDVVGKIDLSGRWDFMKTKF